MKKSFEPIKDGKDAERFVDALKRIVAVPKETVDKELEKERKQRQKARDRKGKG